MTKEKLMHVKKVTMCLKLKIKHCDKNAKYYECLIIFKQKIQAFFVI